MSRSEAKDSLSLGDRFPYDAPDVWWRSGSMPTPPPKDWAHRAARGILSNLADRRSLKHELARYDDGVRAEIVESIAAIIREAAP